MLSDEEVRQHRLAADGCNLNGCSHVEALLSDRAELVAEIDRLRGLICEWLAEFPEFIYDADGGFTGGLPDHATWFDLITRSTAALEARDE